MKKTNKNFIYNIIYQLLVFIIPLVITPYISRVLGVENIGLYSYSYTFVYYFMLASMLGINNYGAREIAKCKTREKTSKTFKSIYSLQLILNMLCIIVYTFSLFLHKADLIIYLLQEIFLISVAFDINWFFFGKEKFKITISRNIIIKLFSMMLIFLFVKEQTDLWKYTLIMSMSTLFSQLYLWLYIRKEVDNCVVTKEEIKSHIKPCLILFIPIIAYSIYRVMDKTMIGFYAGKVELGYYESAEKIVNIPISIITALGTVMMPHMSKKSLDEIETSIPEVFKLTFFMIFPMLIGIMIISTDFTNIFFGPGYEKAGRIIKILIISILFSGIANVIRTNYLIPLKKDKIYVISTLSGAAGNLVLNMIYIPKYGALGACIGTVGAEFLVMLIQLMKTTRDLDYKLIFKSAFQFVVKAIIMGMIMYLVSKMIDNTALRLITQILLGATIYLLLNTRYILYEFIGKRKN